MGRRSAGAHVGSRVLLFAVVLALLVTPLTSVSSAADGDDLALAVTISDATENGVWYSDSQPLEISFAILNDGDGEPHHIIARHEKFQPRVQIAVIN